MDTTETENKIGELRGHRPRLQAPPLKSRRLNGEPYQRLELVDNQIVALSGMPEFERVAEFRRARPEVIAHFIRNGGRKVVAVYRVLCVELVRRLAARVRQHTCGYSTLVAEEIGMHVDLAIMKLVLSGEPEREADFLEVNFYAATEGHIRNALLNWKRSVMGGGRGWIRTDETDEDPIERTIELVPGDGPGAVEILLASENKKLVQRVLQLARHKVKDQRHFEATFLHSFQGWPVTSSDPEVASLVVYFGVSDRTLRGWFLSTLKIMNHIFMALIAGEVQ
jgi:hypothetical protein